MAADIYTSELSGRTISCDGQSEHVAVIGNGEFLEGK